eukprot:CAMPEP_0185570026 /NCGR_PEP_ID=MMETSP0434-20130131/2475_1 /TAXON_ID=626734 ORGANISM="Favella taraikaensis, Strain Fe Narragansett Bay" /NCGR_SAMPLE_ID=MMETSP0434 /ASSEMBLY_ACC=CAM_ASM_000379 /LENGTH=38 /DNA_ID= /DNA_START= /DNA_END= /DNA_ORIENTATION=
MKMSEHREQESEAESETEAEEQPRNLPKQERLSPPLPV